MGDQYKSVAKINDQIELHEEQEKRLSIESDKIKFT